MSYTASTSAPCSSKQATVLDALAKAKASAGASYHPHCRSVGVILQQRLGKARDLCSYAAAWCRSVPM